MLHKYIALFNYFFESLSTRRLFIEIVVNGFIVIWPDFEEFQNSFLPFSNEMKLKGRKIQLDNNIVQRISPPKDAFPPEGLKIGFQPESHPSGEVFSILHQFYTNFDENIAVSHSDGVIEVLFESYELALAYFQTVFVHFQENYDLFGEDKID
jgi:hypothetical protein